MVGWHHRLDGHEFEQAPGESEAQGSLVCCSSWGHKELDITQQLNNSKAEQFFRRMSQLYTSQIKIISRIPPQLSFFPALSLPPTKPASRSRFTSIQLPSGNRLSSFYLKPVPTPSFQELHYIISQLFLMNFNISLTCAFNINISKQEVSKTHPRSHMIAPRYDT